LVYSHICGGISIDPVKNILDFRRGRSQVSGWDKKTRWNSFWKASTNSCLIYTTRNVGDYSRAIFAGLRVWPSPRWRRLRTSIAIFIDVYHAKTWAYDMPAWVHENSLKDLMLMVQLRNIACKHLLISWLL
jgi:hypothetical protein